MKDNPDLLEIRLAAERIVENARRAGDIIKSIRGLAEKWLKLLALADQHASRAVGVAVKEAAH
jgi:hypothetical protein